eukprot:CAMPEP_0172041828 /NCGR_PEP_ID=MMETSP1041-20130122/25317_1 /TAXON_ID=464988 /ORGANISM="Hemiselmis andersenii, Strain CCMP439" /LENGTH=272 /DNA_ID=CAMNT_0012699973 /DNA_START=42 /DNA_END=857 /DNA_ORIENTATION=+
MSSEPSLKDVFANKIPVWQKEIKDVKQTYGDKILGTCTVEQAYGGGQDGHGKLCHGVKILGKVEDCLLDPLREWGALVHVVNQCLCLALPEALLWLLLTGEVPTQGQTQALIDDMNKRAPLPEWIEQTVLNFPKDLHPMTQFSMAILACQRESHFAAAYQKGMKKTEYWVHTYEDMLTCIARLPRIAALIYRNVFKNGDILPGKYDSDMSENFVNMLGFSDPQFVELMRLYLTIHSDHEGGNVSAHTSHLVGSALSDSYLSLSASMNGLAGP